MFCFLLTNLANQNISFYYINLETSTVCRIHCILEQLSCKKNINFELVLSMMPSEKCTRCVLLKQWVEGHVTLAMMVSQYSYI